MKVLTLLGLILVGTTITWGINKLVGYESAPDNLPLADLAHTVALIVWGAILGQALVVLFRQRPPK